MTHITSRTQLLTWLAEHPPNKMVQRAIDRGTVTIWGLFKGGWVVSADYRGKNYVVGIKPVGVERRLICGLLSRVPIEDYVGGDTPLTRGDRPPKTPPPTNGRTQGRP